MGAGEAPLEGAASGGQAQRGSRLVVTGLPWVRGAGKGKWQGRSERPWARGTSYPADSLWSLNTADHPFSVLIPPPSHCLLVLATPPHWRGVTAPLWSPWSLPAGLFLQSVNVLKGKSGLAHWGTR